jgi:hypothetical protein
MRVLADLSQDSVLTAAFNDKTRDFFEDLANEWM